MEALRAGLKLPGGRVCSGGVADQLCRCPAGASPRPTVQGIDSAPGPGHAPVGRGSCPRRRFREATHPHPNEPHSQVCHCEPARTLVWQSVPLQAPRLARPGRGAMLARSFDRPHGRCNADALRGNGLPRRCAPRNHHVFSHHHKRKAPNCHPEAQPKDLMHRGSVSKTSCARSFAFGSG